MMGWRMMAGVGSGVSQGPPPVTGYYAWWDFSDTSSLTISTGISQATDKSGNAHHLLQATGSAQPASQTSASFGGKYICHCDGTADQMATSADSGVLTNTWFAVMMKRSGWNTTTNQTAVRCRGKSTYLNADGLVVYSGTQQGIIAATASQSADYLNPRVHTFTCDGSYTVNYWINKAQRVTALTGSSTSGTFRIASDSATNWGDWDFGELISYTSVLSSGDISTVQDYLMAKWGVS
jgi:hypothetical protein